MYFAKRNMKFSEDEKSELKNKKGQKYFPQNTSFFCPPAFRAEGAERV